MTGAPGRAGPRSDAELVAAVAEVAATAGVSTLSRARYDDLRDRSRHPASSLVAVHVGWSAAVERAGLVPSPMV